MKNPVVSVTNSPKARQRTKLVHIASMTLALGLIVAGPAHSASMMDDAIAAYRHGEFEKSAETFSTLATQGDATAQYLLSCQMINGAGMDANEDAGWDMMKQAAGNQNPDASIVMARKLEAEQAPRDLVRGLYHQAADQNQTQAMLWLALDAVDQGNNDAAKSMLEQAWALGDPRAATLLANRFTKSDSGRYQYLRAAAQRGEMRAAAYLAEEARSVNDTAEAVGWCAIATGLPGHNEDVDWKTIGDAVEKNCGAYDKDLEPAARAENREKVDQFLARFFEGYQPWTPWRACSVN
ncbi:MAG: sel1 repeat family protein [Thalassospira sp.]|uniref:sel1 repeat family protein n=1 Tax=Thalassospira sp. TaxID=1912094 RepID=UPI0032EEFBC8